MESIFESLENLRVSEGCFNDIVSIVDKYINEAFTVSDVLSAADSSIPLRRDKYKEVKSDPSSTPEQIKRASDRFEKASKIRRLLKSSRFRNTQKLTDTVKNAIKDAAEAATMSQEEKMNNQALYRQKELQNIWNRQPNGRPRSSSGFKYGALLKTSRF